MNSKEYFFDRVIHESSIDPKKPLKVLELGCGAAPYVKTLIQKYEHLTYTGVEPIDSSYRKAQQNLQGVPRAQVYFQLGYDAINGLEDESFDVVISFSVLEHVKHLDAFMKLSARYVKKNGIVVHRYDLGHALYPTTLKEKIHVSIGNILPALLPERTFVRYVPQHEVVTYYEQFLGQSPYKYTYHQMPNVKQLAKYFAQNEIAMKAMEEIYAWEFNYATSIAAIPRSTRERLFPTVAVWGKKRP